MAKLTAIAAAVTQTVLVYGPPKVGKTQLAGELAEHPEIEGIIWIDIEKGVETLKKLSPAAQAKIDVIQLPDTRSNPVGIETCLKLVRGTPTKICHEHGKVGCAICMKAKAPMTEYELNKLPPNWVVVFDSLTQLTDSAIAYIGRNQPDDYKFQYDDWGDLGKLMSIFLSHVQQASYNVICISHETEAENEDGTKRIVPVSGTRNASRNTPKYFGHCIYARVSGKKHTFVSSTTGLANVVAGSRADIRLEDHKDDRPTLFPIFAAAAGSVRSSGMASSNAEPAAVSDAEIKREVPAPSSTQDTEKQSTTSVESSDVLVAVLENSAENKPGDSEGNSEAVDHEAAMAGMKLIDRVKYKRAHGLT